MSKLKILGDIVHGEKYEKNGETKWKNTQLGSLWLNEEEGEYVIKFLGQWVKVFPPKMKGEGYQAAKEAVQSAPSIPEDFSDEIPFAKML